MRIVVDKFGITGVCTACHEMINFVLVESETNYYEAEEIVNKWMDHQLNYCKPPVIDNPGGIGYSDFVTSQTLEDKVGVQDVNPPVEDDEDEDYDYSEEDEEYDEDDEEDDDDLK